MQCQLAQGTVLDVPCGYSRFAPVYAHLGITAIGADVSYDMAHLAAANHARHDRELTYDERRMSTTNVVGFFAGRCKAPFAGRCNAL